MTTGKLSEILLARVKVTQISHPYMKVGSEGVKKSPKLGANTFSHDESLVHNEKTGTIAITISKANSVIVSWMC